jgi:D-alanyl-D-alanine dipeptidase
MKKLLTYIFLLSLSSNAWALPSGFIYLDQASPTILTQLRYFSSNNFIGRSVQGYLANRTILTEPAAAALSNIQKELNIYGLGLLIFDAYRPQQAVNNFVHWAKDAADTKTKSQYYPNVDKRDLFKEGYIAEKSGHSRGSTVDLTIVQLGNSVKPLDMGSSFDYFGPQSWPDYANITSQQKANRLLLRTIMMKYGFAPYNKEWWHFTLIDEPFPETYFDFLVQ